MLIFLDVKFYHFGRHPLHSQIYHPLWFCIPYTDLLSIAILIYPFPPSLPHSRFHSQSCLIPQLFSVKINSDFAFYLFILFRGLEGTRPSRRDRGRGPSNSAGHKGLGNRREHRNTVWSRL